VRVNPADPPLGPCGARGHRKLELLTLEGRQVSSPVDPPQACGVVGKSASTGDGATSSWRNDGSEMVGVSFAEGNEAPRRKRGPMLPVPNGAIARPNTATSR
jgi:hypothetical protein